MTASLDRADIQGHVLLPYGRNTYPMGNLLLFHLRPGGGRRSGERPAAEAPGFLEALLPQISTSRLVRSKRTRGWYQGRADRLPKSPPLTINVAFTARGLAAFGVPQSTLDGFPVDFQEGMLARAAVLHDDPQQWDRVWCEETGDAEIHLLILLRVNIAGLLRKAYQSHPAMAPHSDGRERPKAGYHPPLILEQARRMALKRLNLRSELLIRMARRHGLELLSGHGSSGGEGGEERRWQFMETLLRSRAEDSTPAEVDSPQDQGNPDDLRYGEYEHFGFFDGIGDPVFAGQHPPEDADDELIGQGRLDASGWHPLATGEFLLGYPDEAQELPAAAVPLSFSRNGTFLVVRKLHQNVALFERSLVQQLPAFQAWLEERDPPGSAVDGDAPGREAAATLLRAKLVGRWPDGTPLVVAPSYGEWLQFRRRFQELRIAARHDPALQQELTALKRQFRDIRFEPEDSEGGRCPFTSHIRRSNPRDSGDPAIGDEAGVNERRKARSVLTNRRRMLRRGMTYGEPWRRPAAADAPPEAYSDDGRERGTLFMALCTSLSRQFEFVQAQWLNYGSEFGAGNDICPISGVAASEQQRSKLMIAAPQGSDRPPFVLRPATAVTCRGGGYFFLPSLTALRQIAQGLVDPI